MKGHNCHPLIIGEQVEKVKGYRFPGEVRAVFTNKKGEKRYVVEATGEDYEGMLHIFTEDQIYRRVGH